MRNCIFITIFLGSVLMAAGQGIPDVAVNKTEMKKVEKFVGKWVGTGWQQVGPTRENVTGSETVQRKLDGLALLIEGRFADESGAVKHETLAILSYDDQTKSHRFKSFLINGRSGEYELKIVPDGFEWGFKIDQGMIRFSIRLENNVWREVGEFSRDGKNWIKTLEMELKRTQ